MHKSALRLALQELLARASKALLVALLPSLWALLDRLGHAWRDGGEAVVSTVSLCQPSKQIHTQTNNRQINDCCLNR